MLLKQFLHHALTFTLLTASFTAPPLTAAAPLYTQAAAQTADSSDLAARMAALEKAIDARRAQLGIPGISLVIVKDDKVIYLKGLGLKNVERNIPVTPDTLFAIGSAGKAFTAMSVAMTADEAKLSLDDSPKKFLPYFKMQDPEADAKITIRDLLCHRSGLNRTDLAFNTGALNREELIQVAAMAKPTARLRERFQYQNVMYATAGEIVAKAQKTSWEDFIATRILKPLGMKASALNVKDMEKSPDYSYGYEYDLATKETRLLPMQDISSIAPAGMINSSARDISAWLRLMLGGGVFEGKRLVSEKGFNELLSPQMRVLDRVNYGLGWYLGDWHGHKTIYHGGNAVGFSSMVALMPDQKLGFALLSNISSAPLPDEALEIVWSNLVGAPGEIARAGGSDAPSSETASPTARLPEKYKELLGDYEFNGRFYEIVARGNNPALFVPGQRPYLLIEREKDMFAWAGRPLEYSLEVKRGADGKVTGIVVKQPNRTFELKRVAEPAISVDELMSKVIEAVGGEANLRKHTSMVTTAIIDFESQGVTGEATISAKAPNLSAADVTLMALGKKIGAMREYFDGARGAQEVSFAPAQIKTGKSLEAARIEADFYGLLNWKKLFKEVSVKRMSKVGDEDVYVVVKTPEQADPITDYISAKSFLLLKRETINSRSTSMAEQLATATYSDYRMVDGRMIPFRIAQNTDTGGDVVVRVKEVRFDVSLPDSVFRSQARKP
jgi:CubicO group peptidase (beta-lactamase class C family)